MVVEILFCLMEKVCVIFAPLSHSVRRGDMDAWVPPEFIALKYIVKKRE